MAVLSNVNALIMACQMDDGIDELYSLILLLFMYCLKAPHLLFKRASDSCLSLLRFQLGFYGFLQFS